MATASGLELMGAYERKLEQRIKIKLQRGRIKWPPGYKGAIMFCPACTKEILRVAPGEDATQADQRAAVEAHDKVCVRGKFSVVP